MVRDVALAFPLEMLAAGLELERLAVGVFHLWGFHTWVPRAEYTWGYTPCNQVLCFAANPFTGTAEKFVLRTGGPRSGRLWGGDSLPPETRRSVTNLVAWYTKADLKSAVVRRGFGLAVDDCRYVCTHPTAAGC